MIGTFAKPATGIYPPHSEEHVSRDLALESLSERAAVKIGWNF
jgi:hypothetical protein